MADKIIGVFYLTGSTEGTEIPIPNHPAYTEYDSKWWHLDSISYSFTDLHTGSMELVGKDRNGDLNVIYGTTEVGGLRIEQSTSTVLGPFRLSTDPPKFLYSAKESGEPCRVTVILIR